MSQPRNVVLETPELQLQFQWSQDRYQHVVSVPHQGSWLPVLMSVEGTHVDPWPSSPALQSLHLERRGDREIALLVGMSGHSHWSASIQFESDDVLAFDVACRLRGAAGQLGSSYQALLPIQPRGAGWRLVQTTSEAGTAPCGVDIGPWDAVGAASLRGIPGGLLIGPESGLEESPRTVRWGYQVQRCRW